MNKGLSELQIFLNMVSKIELEISLGELSYLDLISARHIVGSKEFNIEHYNRFGFIAPF